jgi:hypothetical protein
MLSPMRALALLLLALTVSVVATAGHSASSADCSRISVGLTPLTDLKTGRYQGYQGGLYSSGRNTPPKAYLKQGLARAKLVKPRDAAGKAAVGGKIVLLSVGMSNTTMEFSEFKREADVDPRKNPSLVIVDGAQGGQDAEIVKDASARYWSVVDQRLERAGVTRAQVQVVWLKEAIIRPTEQFPADAKRLQSDLRQIVALLRDRFPRLQLVYVSSRTYGGYATTPLNPEPYAYQSGFAVKWLVREHTRSKVKSRPWLAWGPYLWTDGTKGRKDGLVWTCTDVRADGTHPSPTSGVRKVAGLLRMFFTTASTATSWFT